MSAFYQRAIGWKTQMLGPEMGDYALVIQLRSVAHRRRELTSAPRSVRGTSRSTKWPAPSLGREAHLLGRLRFCPPGTCSSRSRATRSLSSVSCLIRYVGCPLAILSLPMIRKKSPR
jgi:hypothetical protein